MRFPASRCSGRSSLPVPTIADGHLAGGASVFFAVINVVGGYMVTDRMLAMFGRNPRETQHEPEC